MGTLFDQPSRAGHFVYGEDIEAYINVLKSVSQKTGVSIQDTIAAAHVMQLDRQNTLARDNGDIFDEQVAGIGSILQRIAEALEENKSA